MKLLGSILREKVLTTLLTICIEAVCLEYIFYINII
jgi:hypothetical protein